MDVAVLLRDLGLERQVDLGVAGLDHRHYRADQRHRLLARKTGADAFGKMWVLGFVHGRRVEFEGHLDVAA